MSNKYRFIINQVAGPRKNKWVSEDIQSWIVNGKHQATCYYTEYAGHAKEIAQAASQDEIVVAVGGDGTINEVIAGLMQHQNLLAIIPSGSGNGLARHLRIPMQTAHALKILEMNQVQPLDVLEINGKLAVNVSGIGFDAAVAEAFAQSAGRGLINYLRLIIKLYRTRREFKYEINGIENNAWMISICNSSQYGNNAIISPPSSTGDGLFELAIIRKPTIGKICPLAWSLIKGTICENIHYSNIQTNSISLKLSETQPLHLDGEFMGETNYVQIKIATQLKVLTGK